MNVNRRTVAIAVCLGFWASPLPTHSGVASAQPASGTKVAPDPCGCWVVLQQQDQSASKLIENTASRLNEFLRLDDFELERSIREGKAEAFGIGAGFFGSAEAGAKQEKVREARHTITTSLHQEASRALSVEQAGRQTSSRAIQAWEECVTRCINGVLSSNNRGLSITVEPQDASISVVRVRYNMPADLSKEIPRPRITRVVVFGFQDGLDVNQLFGVGDGRGPELGFVEAALPRPEYRKKMASVTVHTDLAGSVSALLPVNTLPTDEELWIRQKERAFHRGDLVVASQGCFRDRIKIAWRQPDDDELKGQDFLSRGGWYAIAAMQPITDGSGKRAFWWAWHDPRVGEVEITTDVWRGAPHAEHPDRRIFPDLPRDRCVYFTVGFMWGEDKPDRPNRHLPYPAVCGWARAD